MSPRRSLILTLLALAIIGAALFSYKNWRISMRAAADGGESGAVETIAVLPVRSLMWRPSLRVTGTVVAIQYVRLAAPLAGVVRRIAFASGTGVKAGDVLVQLDNIENKARLESAQAEAELAQIKLQRDRDLLPRGAISRSRLEETEAVAKRAAAEVDSARAIFEKKTIRAPFSGYVSIRNINIGQYLAEGEAVVDLQSLDPVYVDFSVPQEHAADLAVGREVIIVAGAPGTARRSARITSVNPGVDAVSRTIRARATLPNADHALRPGSFLQISIPDGEEAPVIAVPTSALRRSAFATSVFVIARSTDHAGQDHFAAEERLVRLGAAFDNQVVVLSGLHVGETVAVAGAFKLRNGAAVRVDNRVLPPGVAPAGNPIVPP